MLEELEKQGTEPPIPSASHFTMLALLPALGLSVPYSYLLWDESKRFEYPFFGWDLMILLGAPFLGFGLAAIATYLFRKNLSWRPTFYWLGVSMCGSFLTVLTVITYFYSIGGVYLGWKRVGWNCLLLSLGLTVYASAFTAVSFYTAIRRSLKKHADMQPVG